MVLFRLTNTAAFKVLAVGVVDVEFVAIAVPAAYATSDVAEVREATSSPFALLVTFANAPH
jgi:hypothetical protein